MLVKVIIIKLLYLLQKTDICEHAIEGLRKSCVKTVHVVGRRGPLQVRYAIVKSLLTATSLQRPLFLGVQFIHLLLFKPLNNMAICLQWQRRLNCIPNCQNNQLTKKSGMVAKLDPYGTLMINHGNGILIVPHLFWCSKHKLSAIFIANAANLTHFFMLTFWFKTLFKFCVRVFYLYPHLWLDYHYGIKKAWT